MVVRYSICIGRRRKRKARKTRKSEGIESTGRYATFKRTEKGKCCIISFLMTYALEDEVLKFFGNWKTFLYDLCSLVL